MAPRFAYSCSFSSLSSSPGPIPTLYFSSPHCSPSPFRLLFLLPLLLAALLIVVPGSSASSSSDDEANIVIDANGDLLIEPPLGAAVRIANLTELQQTKTQLSAALSQLSSVQSTLSMTQANMSVLSSKHSTTQSQLSASLSSLSTLNSVLNAVLETKPAYAETFNWMLVAVGGNGYLDTANVLMQMSGSWGVSYFQWGTIEAMMQVRNAHPACAFVGHKLFVLGGYSQRFNSTLNTMESFDFNKTSSVWTLEPSMNFPRKFAMATTVNNSSLLLTGGQNGIGLSYSSVELYNTASQAWTMVSPMSNKRAAHGSVLWRDQVVVMGGWDGLAVLNSCEMYSPSTDHWTSFPALKVSRELFAVAILQDIIYVFGGYGSSAELASIEAYYPAKNAFQLSTSSMLQTRSGFGAAVYMNQIVLFGGTVNTVDAYDPGTGKWTPNLFPLLPTPRVGAGFAQLSLS